MLRGHKPHKHLTQFMKSNFSIQIQHVQIQGVRHRIYRRWCLRKQEARIEWEKLMKRCGPSIDQVKTAT